MARSERRPSDTSPCEEGQKNAARAQAVRTSSRPRAVRWPVWFWGTCLSVACAAAWLPGCKRSETQAPPSAVQEAPTLRLYALGGVAGAIEPCGCVADMLGGVDHAAAWLKSQQKKAPHSLLLGAGPLFFTDPRIDAKEHHQAWLKAETLADALREMGLVAWAPGVNDFALGVSRLGELQERSRARVLGANWQAKLPGGLVGHQVVQVHGIPVGLVGVSLFPPGQEGLSAVTQSAAEAALQQGREAARAQGAQLLVALLAGPRGEALRLAERVEGYQVWIVGKALEAGGKNEDPYPPEIVDGKLVVQAPNHLQGVAVIDLFIRGEQFQFADGSGLEARAERESWERRAAELRRRMQAWSAADSGVQAEELAQRKKDLEELEARIAAWQAPAAPQEGSYLYYDLVEVRESWGEDAPVAARLKAYYRTVNDYNREAFAGRKPPELSEDQAGYVGIERCSTCHSAAKKFWDGTRHARAYETLVKDHKEFNLDCVSCHVTGYEKPGGSTVTHVEGLTDVQCEVCHGPGSKHVENPGLRGSIQRVPEVNLCASSCHHPPHVGADWDVSVAWQKILGPGHGR